MSKTAVIGSDTRIPLGAVWTVGCSLVGLIVWLTTMWVDVKYMKDNIIEIRADVKEIKNSGRAIGAATVTIKN